MTPLLILRFDNTTKHKTKTAEPLEKHELRALGAEKRASRLNSRTQTLQEAIGKTTRYATLLRRLSQGTREWDFLSSLDSSVDSPEVIYLNLLESAMSKFPTLTARRSISEYS